MTARLGQLTLIITILAVGYFIFSSVQGSVKVGKTITNTGSSLETGLVGHWTFDGPDVDWGSTTAEVQDVSGNDYHGNATTTMPKTSTTQGAIGQAIHFDGTDDGINMGDVLGFDNSDTFSLSAWVKIDPGGNFETIMGKKMAGSPYSGYRLYFQNDQIWLDINGGTAGKTAIIKTVATYTGPTDWIHVVGTYDGSSDTSGMNLYINGEDVPTTVFDNDLTGSITNTKPFTIGYRDTDPTIFHGAVDDARVYDRVLSTYEVTQLYNQGSGSKQNTTVTPEGLKSGLVGHWTFDGPDMTTATATDASGNGNDSTRSGGPTPGIGVLGQSLEFDGIDGYLHCTDANCGGTTGSGLDMGTRDMSLSAWVKPADTDVAGIVSKESGDGNDGYTFFYAGDGKFDCLFNIAASAFGCADEGTVPVGEWSHLAATADRDGFVRRYINGVEIGTPLDISSESGTSVNNTKDFCIGSRAVDGGSGCSNPLFAIGGAFDDVRVYDRLLTTNEIQQLYLQGGGTKINETLRPSGLQSGLVGHWTFDGKHLTTATATDSSGNGNDGTRNGGVKPTFGKIGQALDFDGTNDYVQVGSPAELDDLGPYTLSAWVYRRNDISDYGYILGKRDGACTGEWKWQPTPGGSLEWFKAGVGNVSRNMAAGSIPSNEWALITTTWDGGVNYTGVHHYVNGVETAYTNEGNATSLNSDATCAFNIGSLNAGGAKFDGLIDDVRVYDRVLSTGEIAQLYNMGR